MSDIPFEPLTEKTISAMSDLAAVLSRLDQQATPITAIALREGFWPGVTGLFGYPVYRLHRSAIVPFGVLV